MLVSRRHFLGGLGAAVGTLALEGIAPAKSQAKLPFAELRLAGSAGQVGFLHGRGAAPLIKRNIAFYLRWFAEVIKLPPKQALAVAARFAEPLRRHLPAMLEEIDGIAKGAGVSRAEILALNARTDLLVVGRSKRAKHAGLSVDALHAQARPGCTALALRGGSARHPLLALGQNWDWRRALTGNVVLLRVARSGAPRLLTLTEAGMVGKIGFNEHGLGVCLNFLGHKSERPEGPLGLPVHVLLRAVLEQKTLADAYKLVAWAPRSASANFLMAQHARGAAPAAIDLEWTPTAMARLPLAGAALVHTNHFRDAALAPGCDSGFGKSTMNRLQRAEKRAAELAAVADPAQRMQQILRDRVGAPLSVSKTATKGSRSQTLASIVMDLSRNRLWLCAGEPHRGRYVSRPGV